jgi:WD40 repeat protein
VEDEEQMAQLTHTHTHTHKKKKKKKKKKKNTSPAEDGDEGEALVIASDGTEKALVAPRALFATGRLDKTEGKILRFKSGDRYAHDLRNTRGHVSPITCVAWDNPRHATRALTGSLDGTVREWDLSRAEKGSVSFMRVSAARQMTNQVTALRVFNVCGGGKKKLCFFDLALTFFVLTLFLF